MSRPLVSVLTTCFNRADFIGEAIESVRASSYQDFELIVVDDCSTDESYSIAKAYQQQDDRVRVYRNENNLGDYPNRNEAARHARGKYIKYLDSDDLIYPHGLEVMVTCMESVPGAGYGLSANGDTNGLYPSKLSAREAYIENFFENNLFGRAPGSSIINREAFWSVDGFSGRRQVGDHEFWLKISKCFDLVKMPRDLVWDRAHGEKESAYDSDLQKAKMHMDVVQAALDDDRCPLNSYERQYAVWRMKRPYAREMVLHLLRGRVAGAMRIKRQLEISLMDLAKPIPQ
jgi:glycosyltransferase involved in cell wall biosynthesis